jgi:hypothetical protein
MLTDIIWINLADMPLSKYVRDALKGNGVLASVGFKVLQDLVYKSAGTKMAEIGGKKCVKLKLPYPASYIFFQV